MQVSSANRFHRAAFALVVLLAAGCYGQSAIGNEHPRLLINADDVPRIRRLCGVAADGASPDLSGIRAGDKYTDYSAIRDHFGVETPETLFSGELLAIAFLHVVEGSTTSDALRMKALETWFRRPDWTMSDLLEASIALDWCWDAIREDVRRDFLTSIRRRLRPLASNDNPLDHKAFREKLGALALAVAVDETEDTSAAWKTLRTQIVSDAARYRESTFAGYIALRGLAPTIPESAADEENDAAWLIELADRIDESELWPQYRTTVGRWLEHYAYGFRTNPPLKMQFAHDGGLHAPNLPSGAWSDLHPITAHLIASRTQDAAAAAAAGEIERNMRASGAPTMATIWRWVPIVFSLDELPQLDSASLPAARNFGSAVFLRGGTPEDQTLVRIDAGGVYLRRNQYFDAGNFHIHRGGYVTGGGDEFVTLEAVPGKSGSQRLGRDKQQFDFNQYAASTIAHNCLIFHEPMRPVEWHGRKYLPIGGQRLFEDGSTDFATAPIVHSQRTGRLVALGTTDSVSYAAVDLAAAYPSDRVSEYSREFVFLWGRVLLVIDRARTVGSKTSATFVMHLPARPLVDGADLSPEWRIAGASNDGGIWKCGDVDNVEWRGDAGVARITPLWPRKHHVALCGGPAKQIVIADGPNKGMTYVGGAQNSFERLIQPIGQGENENAWYQLGSPTILGPDFGTPSHWGRVEIEHPRGIPVLFVNAVILDPTHSMTVELDHANESDTSLHIIVRSAERSDEVVITRGELGGRVLRKTPEEAEWEFPSEVERELPLGTK